MAQGFKDRLSYLCGTYTEQTKDVVIEARREIAARIVKRTPVDSGDARKNWKDRGNKEAPIWEFVNDARTIPYIFRLEYEQLIKSEGVVRAWSPQAPHGMVRISAAEWPEIVRGAARFIKNGS